MKCSFYLLVICCLLVATAIRADTIDVFNLPSGGTISLNTTKKEGVDWYEFKCTEPSGRSIEIVSIPFDPSAFPSAGKDSYRFSKIDAAIYKDGIAAVIVRSSARESLCHLQRPISPSLGAFKMDFLPWELLHPFFADHINTFRFITPDRFEIQPPDGTKKVADLRSDGSMDLDGKLYREPRVVSPAKSKSAVPKEQAAKGDLPASKPRSE